jgi:hypothetical protein
VQSLAGSLHVTVAQLEKAHEQALQQTIQRAYSDKKITKQQETDLLNKAAEAQDPCAAVDRVAAAHAHLKASRAAVVSAVAAKLQMQPSTLQSDLASGQTIPQLAAAKGVSVNDVNTTYLDAVRHELNLAVQRGDVTTSQADQAFTRIQKAVAQGYYPLLQSGHEPGNMMW